LFSSSTGALLSDTLRDESIPETYASSLLYEDPLAFAFVIEKQVTEIHRDK
jgi:hypothetical protein